MNTRLIALISLVLGGLVATSYATYSIGQSDGWQEGSRNGFELGFLDGNSSGYQSGFDLGNSTGYSSGYSVGNDTGYQNGYNSGYESGYPAGNAVGYEVGHKEGFDDGNSTGYERGFHDGNSSGYVGGYQIGYVDGNESGWAFGYNFGLADGYTDGYDNGFASGNQSGYNAGYSDGLIDGAEHGFNIRDPTHAEMISFIRTDQTDKNEYTNDYVCWNFAADTINNAFDVGYRCGFVYVEFTDGAHAVVCFKTIDSGMIFIEPQTDDMISIALGYSSYYDDVIVEFVIIW